MEGLKWVFKFCYTIMGGGGAIVLIMFTINDPVKKLDDYQTIQGKVEISKHTNIKGDRTRFKLYGEPEWHYTFLDRDKRYLLSTGVDVKVWFSETLLNNRKVKQVSVNGELLWKYDYSRQIGLQNQFIAVSSVLIVGLVLMHRRFLLKKLR